MSYMEKRKRDRHERKKGMAATIPILHSPHSLFTSSNILFFRNQVKTRQILRKCGVHETIVASSCVPSNPTSQDGFCRRDLMLFGFSSSAAMILPFSESRAEDGVKMASMVDDVNAYSYLYPLELSPKKFLFKWFNDLIDFAEVLDSIEFFFFKQARVESRKPERYSSAAPLSPDARLRIVSERVDIIDNLIISITIGPPNATFLKMTDKSKWVAKDVADSVLSDKSALRVTSSQRMAESSVLDAHTSEIDGEPYWYYEYLVRKSPTKSAQESNNFRHYIASTFERDGFLYTLNASTLNKQWDTMGPLLKKTVASFQLLPATENYVPPSKDPWRFW